MEELFRESTDIGSGFFAVTLAQYDADAGVLVVDQQATRLSDAGEAEVLPGPGPRRIEDTACSRSAAIRYVVAIADEWIGIVRGSVASA